jgi:hypothetical protein
MPRKLKTLVKRQRALQKVMAKFGGKPFKLGTNDCVKLTRFHLGALGHKLPSTGRYTTAVQAAAALKKQGVKNLEQLLDKYLERIPPAMMLPGDLAMPPSDPDAPAAKIGTVMVAVTPRKFLGWHPDHESLAVMELTVINAAWRA